jgi:GTP cyclohydrolase FolE2
MAKLPIITHNQRNRTQLSLTVGEDDRVEDILDVIGNAQGSPTYAILKRGGRDASFSMPTASRSS